jgi:large subunit ribosomal protein L19
LSESADHDIFPFLARSAGYLYGRRIFVGEDSMSDLLLRSMDAPVNEALPKVQAGDNVTIHLRVVEGKRERIQLVRGTIIRTRKSGNQENFTVRRIAANGIGVERTFLTRSPRIERIEVHRHSHVRRAQLYFLRERTGKSARLREKRYA